MTNSSSSIFDCCEYVNLTAGQTCAICSKPDGCQTLVGRESGGIEAHVCREYRKEHWSKEPDIQIEGAGVFLLDSASQTKPTGFNYQIKPKSERSKAATKVQNRV